MQTTIHVSKKLEKAISKLIKNPTIDTSEGILGKWNATLFYMDRKKCWLFVNAKTAYSLVLINVKSADLGSIDDAFKDALYAQLVYDGIIIDFSYLSAIIGTVNFCSTDNDKRTIGFQNQRIHELDLWKHQYETIDKMPIKDLTNRMNSVPIHLGKSKKMSDFTTSINEIKQLF